MIAGNYLQQKDHVVLDDLNRFRVCGLPVQTPSSLTERRASSTTQLQERCCLPGSVPSLTPHTNDLTIRPEVGDVPTVTWCVLRTRVLLEVQ